MNKDRSPANYLPNRPFGKIVSEHPVIIIVGFLAALIAIFIFVTGVVSLPSLFSSEARLQRRLVGSWQESSGAILTFYESGVFEESGSFLPISGYYTVTDGDHISVEMSGLFGLAGSQVWQVTISGNSLYVVNTWDGSSFSATKIR